MVRRANVDQAMDMRAAALCLAALAACGGGLGELAEPAGPALADHPAPAEVVDPLIAIHAGEQMRFEVRLAGVLAGEASFTTVALSDADGAPTATLTSSIRSAGALADSLGFASGSSVGEAAGLAGCDAEGESVGSGVLADA